jgi:hypothetical protein
MRKEIIVAIIIGLFLGLIVAFGIRTARNSLQNRQLPLTQTNPTTDSSTTTTTLNHNVFITTPEPNAVVNTNSVTIIGTTSPSSLISIIGNVDQIAAAADKTGNFTATVELSPGVNTIAINSYNEAGQSADASFMVIYTTADLQATASATPAEE